MLLTATKTTDHIELGFDAAGKIRAAIFGANAEALWRSNVEIVNQMRDAVRSGPLNKNDPDLAQAKADYGVTFVNHDAPLATWTEAFCAALARFQLNSARDIEIATAPTRIAGFRALRFLPEEAADHIRITMGRTAHENFVIWENESGRCDRIEKSAQPFGFLSDAQKRAVVAGKLKIRNRA